VQTSLVYANPQELFGVHLPPALSKQISASFDCFERNNRRQLQNVSTELSVQLKFVTSLNNLEVQSKGVKWRQFVHSH
jgi:hypothetical protein